MGLVFQENTMEYLSRVFCETMTQEQTAELIVPDSYPDAQRVVDAFGTAILRAADCSGDSASVTGEVLTGLLFVTEDGDVQRLEAAVPFSFRRDFDSPQEECNLQCRCSVRSVDARMLNSRKVLVRVGIVCTMTVYAHKEKVLYDVQECEYGLQVKRTQLPMQVPLALGDKSFTLNEELELPGGKPSIERLLKCVYRTEIQEQKMVGSKAVFKGSLCVHSLYECAEGMLHSFESVVPFSQYVDMDYELDDRDLRTVLVPTSVETEPDGQIECRRLLLSANLLAQCTAFGEQTVEVIADAYCTEAQMLPQWDEWEMSSILDKQIFRESVVAAASEPVQSVVDAWVWIDEGVKSRQGEHVSVELPLTFSVLYYDTEGELQGKTLRPSMNVDTELAQSSDCRVSGASSGEVFAGGGSNGMEIRCPISVELESYAKNKMRCICGGEVEELADTGERKPSVILRRTDQEQDVWDIAKSYRARTQDLMDANNLESPLVSAGSLLLIPM
ncbi:MAG: DUF3794 domain-containing protein [Oscillospiraceae bacterium]|jgi:hypothetical protein|nr:DUF3794 domain-containing protein [Oscillospiraceae bacterium]